jgi:hypothetical protein
MPRKCQIEDSGAAPCAELSGLCQLALPHISSAESAQMELSKKIGWLR